MTARAGWHALTHIGVDASVGRRDRRYIVFLNTLVVFVVGILVPMNLLAATRFLPQTQPMLYVHIANGIGLSSAMLLNTLRRHAAARLAFVGTAIVFITVVPVLEGKALEAHLFHPVMIFLFTGVSAFGATRLGHDARSTHR
jgi:hypothetical protein